ncbi:Uma2 family endonuclease [Streptomyces sp. HNM0663]|uniref:Uma2 family endonuclease n=1 Tax=Streptomyces chengmaiensis TaxID=3040919 RepID=A0ABT6HVJ4_9ACTN|nr:Uma2 family endonuclease [Streptomyces chengmaiensis]MDH2392737.1 Uma2 family endonuclease [Streptomyces chengmaiensis]
MHQPRRGKHAEVVRVLRRQIDADVHKGLVAYEVVSIRGRGGGMGDAVTADLAALPAEWGASDETLADPHDVALAVEVGADEQQVARYAGDGVPVLLVVDPRHGDWTLYDRPEGGRYQGVHQGHYGDDIPVPEPLSLALATGLLPRYG